MMQYEDGMLPSTRCPAGTDTHDTGSVHIGSHRDNLENRVIASVSVGAERTFHMEYAAPRPRATKGKAAKASDAADDNDNVKASKKKWLLKNGSLVVMQGETQRYWKHAIPKLVRPPYISMSLMIGSESRRSREVE